MCPQMETAFGQLSLPCPPWRTHKAMVARWLVSSADDVQVEALQAN